VIKPYRNLWWRCKLVQNRSKANTCCCYFCNEIPAVLASRLYPSFIFRQVLVSVVMVLAPVSTFRTQSRPTRRPSMFSEALCMNTSSACSLWEARMAPFDTGALRPSPLLTQLTSTVPSPVKHLSGGAPVSSLAHIQSGSLLHRLVIDIDNAIAARDVKSTDYKSITRSSNNDYKH
jgi:hypothetical protein